MQFQDPIGPVDIGCGMLIPVRSSQFGSILSYDHDRRRAPAGCEDKVFEFNCITLTTRGDWEFHGRAGKRLLDSGELALGVAGDAYGCKHRLADSNLIVGLRAGALDPDHPPIFDLQVIPSAGTPALLKRAIAAPDDERFDSLIFGLFDEISKASQRGAVRKHCDVRMQRAKRFLERHAFERVGLADLAHEIGLSPFTALRQFRAATGRTPYAYVLEIRLERAKRLLAHTAFSIQAIALATGFETLAHFAHFFKDRTGYSASAFRSGGTVGKTHEGAFASRTFDQGLCR